MLGGFWRRPLGAWLVTLTAGLGLFYMGYETGARLGDGGPAAEEARQEALYQAEKAGRLTAENDALEKRAQSLEAELAGLRGGAPAKEPGPPEVAGRVLRESETALLLEGKVLLTLLDVKKQPPGARFRIRVGKEEGRVLLGPGELMPFRVGGKRYSLLLKRIMPNSAIIAVLAQ